MAWFPEGRPVTAPTPPLRALCGGTLAYFQHQGTLTLLHLHALGVHGRECLGRRCLFMEPQQGELSHVTLMLGVVGGSLPRAQSTPPPYLQSVCFPDPPGNTVWTLKGWAR